MMTPRRAEAGFTLPEVLIAGTLAAALSLPAFALLRSSYDAAERMLGRFALNAQARQILGTLADGSAAPPGGGSATGTSGFTLVEGIRSRAQARLPAPAALRDATGRFQLADGSLTLQGDALATARSFTCRGLRAPLPLCTGTETRTLGGWLGREPTVVRTGRVVALGITVTDPYRADRARPASGATEQYRTMIQFQVEATP